MRLFEDPFLLAVPADDPQPETARVSAQDVDQSRLILLEQGHCLRDQALAFCAPEKLDMQVSLGAASLATIMQMVANSYAVTLLPEVAVDAEVRDERVKLLRFAAPVPSRTIGLALAARLAAQSRFRRVRAACGRSLRPAAKSTEIGKNGGDFAGRLNRRIRERPAADRAGARGRRTQLLGRGASAPSPATSVAIRFRSDWARSASGLRRSLRSGCCALALADQAARSLVRPVEDLEAIQKPRPPLRTAVGARREWQLLPRKRSFERGQGGQ